MPLTQTPLLCEKARRATNLLWEYAREQDPLVRRVQIDHINELYRRIECFHCDTNGLVVCFVGRSVPQAFSFHAGLLLRVMPSGHAVVIKDRTQDRQSVDPSPVDYEDLAPLRTDPIGGKSRWERLMED